MQQALILGASAGLGMEKSRWVTQPQPRRTTGPCCLQGWPLVSPCCSLKVSWCGLAASWGRNNHHPCPQNPSAGTPNAAWERGPREGVGGDGGNGAQGSPLSCRAPWGPQSHSWAPLLSSSASPKELGPGLQLPRAPPKLCGATWEQRAHPQPKTGCSTPVLGAQRAGERGPRVHSPLLRVESGHGLHGANLSFCPILLCHGHGPAWWSPGDPKNLAFSPRAWPGSSLGCVEPGEPPLLPVTYRQPSPPE